MPLTREFKETIMKRVQSDPDFRRALFTEAINELLDGDLEVAKSMLRDYINATISFEPLAEELNKNSKSIQRMFGPRGNPTAKSLFEILHILQKAEGIHFVAHAA
jgi:hypothetical protein